MATFLATLGIFVSIVLIGVILLQRGRGGGLVGALSGLGGQSAFGTKAGDTFTRITIVIALVWVLLAGFEGQALRAGKSKFKGNDPTNIESSSKETGASDKGGDSKIDNTDLLTPSEPKADETKTDSSEKKPADSPETPKSESGEKEKANSDSPAKTDDAKTKESKPETKENPTSDDSAKKEASTTDKPKSDDKK